MHVRVAFPHRGPDGDRRMPGDIVDIPEEEARQLLHDGLCGPADGPPKKMTLKRPIPPQTWGGETEEQ